VSGEGGAPTVEIVAGGRLRLLADRAAFDPDARCLLVADAHVGKAASFRALGVPVPVGTTADTLLRLTRLLGATAARRIVFLGDLLHSARGRAPGTLQALAEWRARHARVELTLVRGNHDRRAGDPPPALDIEVVDGPLRLGAWALAHAPEPLPGAYVLGGHVHPCVVLGGRANDRLRLPCFHFGAHCGVLPAFGAFTGMHALPRAAGDRIWAIAGDRVVEVAGAAPPTLAA
jgi:DNA ligase-associated metallophosphoesterase